MVISAVQWEKPEPGLGYPSFLSIGTMILCGPLFSSTFSRLISNSSQREVDRKKLLSHKFLFRIIFWAWREKDAPVRGVTSVPCVWTSGELSLGPCGSTLPLHIRNAACESRVFPIFSLVLFQNFTISNSMSRNWPCVSLIRLYGSLLSSPLLTRCCEHCSILFMLEKCFPSVGMSM